MIQRLVDIDEVTASGPPICSKSQPALIPLEDESCLVPDFGIDSNCRKQPLEPSYKLSGAFLGLWPCRTVERLPQEYGGSQAANVFRVGQPTPGRTTLGGTRAESRE